MKRNLELRIRAFEKKQVAASLMALLLLLWLSVVFNFIHLNRQAQQTAKFLSRMIQIEDFREVGVTLQEARLDHFDVIKYVSADSRRSFTLPEVAELSPNKSIWRDFTHDSVTLEIATATSSHDKVIFEFSRFKETGWALLVWLALNLVSFPQTRLMKKRIVQGFDESLRVEAELARADIARKLRHNIRTPLSALMRLSSRKGSLDSNQALLINVIGHIKNLVSDLDESENRQPSNILFYPVLTDAMREIRLVSPSRLTVTTEVDDTLISAHGRFVGHELRSILANLATNAFDAVADGGRVDIKASDYGDRVLIEVKDTGRGIAPEEISRVTEKGYSAGKATGTGLGLYHAKANIDAWKGEIRISSGLGVGTTVLVSLSIDSRASWYVPRIKLRQSDRVVVVDDQVSVHDVWRERLSDSGFAGQTTFFANGATALSHLRNASSGEDKTVVFADFDLETQATGLDLLARLPKGMDRFLVTGHFDDETIQAECSISGIPMIPKTALGEIPIVVV